MQVPHNLVKSGREGAVDVAEEALGVGEAEGAPEVHDDGLEALGGADFTEIASQPRRSAPDRLEAHHHLAVGVGVGVAGACGWGLGRGGSRGRCQRRRRVTW